MHQEYREIIERLHRIQITVDEIARHENQITIIPILGPITEQTGPPVRPCPPCGPIHHSRILIMAFTMTDSQQVPLSATFADKKGNPTTPPAGAVVSFASSNTDVLTVAPGADANSCLVLAAGPLATASVTCSVVDASGAPFAAGSIDITITSGAPSQVTVTPGVAVEQP